MDLNALATGLATAAGTIAGLTGLAYAPDSVPEPCFYVQEFELDYDAAMSRGLDAATVTCMLIASRADDRSGQEAIRAWLAGGSLKAAIDDAAAPGGPLDGVCDDLRVTRAVGPRQYQIGDTWYYGAEITVYVIGDGS